MILKIQNFCEKKIVDRQSKDLMGSNSSGAAGREGSFFHRNFQFLISLKIVSQYDVNSEFD